MSLNAYIEARVAEAGRIPTSRRSVLEDLAQIAEAYRRREGRARLVFICTHNSRRSQMAQVWAWVTAEIRGIGGIEVFSGGTEATAFAPPAIDALRRAGLMARVGEGANPTVEMRVPGLAGRLLCSSARFDAEPNPASGFCAVMTCASADADCPYVPGADTRLSLPYEDPKRADGLPEQEAVYDQSCADIAREMLFAFTLLRPDRGPVSTGV